MKKCYSNMWMDAKPMSNYIGWTKDHSRYDKYPFQCKKYEKPIVIWIHRLVYGRCVCVALRAIRNTNKGRETFCLVRLILAYIQQNKVVGSAVGIVCVTMDDFQNYDIKYYQVSYNDPRAFWIAVTACRRMSLVSWTSFCSVSVEPGIGWRLLCS